MSLTYSVRPRYTAGSPAGVGPHLAERVATEEKDAIQFVLDGYVGEEARVEAERLGLQRIAYCLGERGNHFCTLYDLCTDERIEGWREVEAELACMGTRRLPRHVEKLIPSWILPAFEQSDLIDRREIVRLALRGDAPALARFAQEKLLGVVIEQ